AKFQLASFGSGLGMRVDHETLFRDVDHRDPSKALESSLTDTLRELDGVLGTNPESWSWGKIHHLTFKHPLNVREWNRGPIARPGDSYTVNSGAGTGFRQTNGASFREVIDVADWDRSVMTNTPGESGDPNSPHYADLLQDWAEGR